MTPEEALQFLASLVMAVRNMDFISDDRLDKADEAIEVIRQSF